MKHKKLEIWSFFTLAFLVLAILFLVYPMLGILKQAVISPE